MNKGKVFFMPKKKHPYIPELHDEYRLVESRLSQDDPCVFVVFTRVDKGTLLVNVYIRSLSNVRKVRYIGDFESVEVYDEQTDQERQICSDYIRKVLDGTHFVTKRAYYPDAHTDYYIKPDWSYWFAQK